MAMTTPEQETTDIEVEVKHKGVWTYDFSVWECAADCPHPDHERPFSDGCPTCGTVLR
jgi:hypothetical protein